MEGGDAALEPAGGTAAHEVAVCDGAHDGGR
jgi:hypothetical protein